MPRTRSFLFDRWPRFAFRHPWYVLAGAVAVLAALLALYALAGGRYVDKFTIPGTESQRLTDLLERRFPQTAGDPATVVVRAPAGLGDPQVHSRVDSLLADLSELPDVVSVSSPYEQSGAISPDGTIARVNVQYARPGFELERSSLNKLLDLRKEYSSPAFQVEVGGPAVRAVEVETVGVSEFVGLGAATVILLIAFGSVVAMGLPIVTALLTLASGYLLVGLAAAFLDVPSFAPSFFMMIGIGVGIDYALLIVTRFRERLAQNSDLEQAIAKASGTAGRSVVFAGSTVVVALLGLWAARIPFLGYIVSAAALVVALAVIVAIFVLPAIFRLVGSRVDRWRIPIAAALPHESEAGFGYRLSRLIQRAPLAGLAVSLAVPLVLAIPLLHIDLGSADQGNNPKSLTSRRAYDLISEGFGPGFNGPIIVGVSIDDPASLAALEGLLPMFEGVEGVASVSPVQFNETRSAATITVIPKTAPQSQDTEELVDRLRHVVPQAVQGDGSKAFVGGPTAVFIDVSKKIASSMSLLLGIVIGLSFLLLMVAFRSVLVSLIAAATSLLSVGAAFGVLVAVFQWGWLGGIFGVDRTGPIESFLPVVLFAILFGLSMDYSVFLITRIREEYLRTGSSTEAVAAGVSLTARVIAAAATIMAAVFLSFTLSDSRTVKEIGLGLGVAILVDATLVRLTLVPSLMRLLGDASWWFPGWLDRLVPRISVDAEPELASKRLKEPVPATCE